MWTTEEKQFYADVESLRRAMMRLIRIENPIRRAQYKQKVNARFDRMRHLFHQQGFRRSIDAD